MALLTDASVITLDDLLQYESAISQVASSHGIDVENKINLATSVVGDALLLWLQNAGASDPQWLTRRILGLSTVVVTEPLQRWLIFESLSRVYAEAYNVQLNTRFQGKWNEYQQQSHDAAALFFQEGVAIVYNPLPKPSMPLVSVQSGPAPGTAIFVQTAWVDANGNESALSVSNAIVLPNNSGFAVAMSEGALNAPAAAAGWNLYANSESVDLSRQNSFPLAIGSTWQMPASGLQAGPNPIDGQKPAFYIALSKQIRRG